MQIGAENQKKTVTAIALMVAAIVFAVIRFSSGSSPAAAKSPALAAPLHAPVSRIASPATLRMDSAARSLDPTLRYDWLKASEDVKYEGTGRNIFQAQVDIPQPVKPVATDHSPPQPPPGPPPPPPITLKFFGFANKPGEPRKVFLSEGDDVFIAGEGEIVDRRYKILRITPNSVEVEDVLNNNRQSIQLTPG
jgi:hypothetical protein